MPGTNGQTLDDFFVFLDRCNRKLDRINEGTYKYRLSESQPGDLVYTTFTREIPPSSYSFCQGEFTVLGREGDYRLLQKDDTYYVVSEKYAEVGGRKIVWENSDLTEKEVMKVWKKGLYLE